MSGVSGGLKADRWRERFQRYQKSCQTVSQFCETEDVSIAAFYNWKKKISELPVSGPAFQSLEVIATDHKATSFVTVRMPNGIEVELGHVPLLDAELLQQLFALSLPQPDSSAC